MIFFPIEDSVLNKDIPKEIFSSQCLICVEIFADTSNFYEDLDNFQKTVPAYSLPTTDLKEITREWMEYLKAN